ncbi:hypothetical protein BK325_21810 [Escherichia coli]|nr:hypothetical protein BK325_21810 [Escherichia coli]
MAGVRQHGWRAIPAVCSEYGADTLPDRYRSDGRCLLFWQQAGISALKQELEVKTPYRAMNHPVIGVVTKADLASMEQISLVKSWLREAGAYFHERRSLNNFHRDRVITFEQIAE